MLKLADVSKTDGDQQVLRVERLHFHKGVTWLFGTPSTAKTTLLRIIAGIESFEGNLILQDIDIRQSPVDYRRKVNFGEANPSFPTSLSGMELIQLFRVAKGASEEQMHDLVKAFQVQSFIKQGISNYSLPMLKKLSLILTFLGQPALILLDEPFLALDKPAQQILLHQLTKSWVQNEISFIISTEEKPVLGEGIPIYRLYLKDGTVGYE